MIPTARVLTLNCALQVHWIGSMIFAAIVGIANYSIYMATIDYMICAYGPYSASATGGNGWSRDFLAGVLTVPATPFFTNIGASKGRNLEYANTILACIATVLVIAVYIIYWKGPVLRKRSPFAQQLAEAKSEDGGRRVSALPNMYGSRRASKLFHFVHLCNVGPDIRFRCSSARQHQRERWECWRTRRKLCRARSEYGRQQVVRSAITLSRRRESRG